MRCPLFDFCDSITATCRVKEPDEGCYYYRYFKDLIQRNEEKKEKTVFVCDDCTAKSWCDDEERGHKERCFWYSTNPGGI